MKKVFAEADIDKIANTLETQWNFRQNNYRMMLIDSDSGRKLTLEIYPDVQIGNQRGNLISVFTKSTHLQLHFCTGYVVSDMLGEVTFFGGNEGQISGGKRCLAIGLVGSSIRLATGD